MFGYTDFGHKQWRGHYHKGVTWWGQVRAKASTAWRRMSIPMQAS